MPFAYLLTPTIAICHPTWACLLAITSSYFTVPPSYMPVSLTDSSRTWRTGRSNVGGRTLSASCYLSSTLTTCRSSYFWIASWLPLYSPPGLTLSYHERQWLTVKDSDSVFFSPADDKSVDRVVKPGESTYRFFKLFYTKAIRTEPITSLVTELLLYFSL